MNERLLTLLKQLRLSGLAKSLDVRVARGRRSSIESCRIFWS